MYRCHFICFSTEDKNLLSVKRRGGYRIHTWLEFALVEINELPFGIIGSNFGHIQYLNRAEPLTIASARSYVKLITNCAAESALTVAV